MFVTIEEGREGLGYVIKKYKAMQIQKRRTEEEGEQTAASNIAAMQQEALRAEAANIQAGRIRMAQEMALNDMFRNFFGIPWKQAALVGGAAILGLAILWSD